MKIRNANSKGYLEAEEGDGIDVSSRMETHRGTVQKGMCQTIQTQCDIGVIDNERERVVAYEYENSLPLNVCDLWVELMKCIMHYEILQN